MRPHLHAALLLALLSPAAALPALQATPASPASASLTPAPLSIEEAGKLMPPAVFFKGQTAPIQARNAVGIRFGPESYLLAALVDTSGYSSQVQARYQAYFITQEPLSIDGHPLPPGAYGVGFLPSDSFVVMDLGGNDLFTAHSASDPTLRRPRPLQIVPNPTNASQFRLYSGRTFVTLDFKPAGKP